MSYVNVGGGLNCALWTFFSPLFLCPKIRCQRRFEMSAKTFAKFFKQYQRITTTSIFVDFRLGRDIKIHLSIQ